MFGVDLIQWMIEWTARKQAVRMSINTRAVLLFSCSQQVIEVLRLFCVSMSENERQRAESRKERETGREDLVVC